jgi:hypothetical protein
LNRRVAAGCVEASDGANHCTKSARSFADIAPTVFQCTKSNSDTWQRLRDVATNGPNSVSHRAKLKSVGHCTAGPVDWLQSRSSEYSSSSSSSSMSLCSLHSAVGAAVISNANFRARCESVERSDYYEGSAHTSRQRRAWRLAGCFRAGARAQVPVFPRRTADVVGAQLYPCQLWPHLIQAMDVAQSSNRSLEIIRRRRPAHAASSAVEQRFIIRTVASDAEFNTRVNQHARFTVTSVVAFPRQFRIISPGISRLLVCSSSLFQSQRGFRALTDSA